MFLYKLLFNFLEVQHATSCLGSWLEFLLSACGFKPHLNKWRVRVMTVNFSTSRAFFSREQSLGRCAAHHRLNQSQSQASTAETGRDLPPCATLNCICSLTIWSHSQVVCVWMWFSCSLQLPHNTSTSFNPPWLPKQRASAPCGKVILVSLFQGKG